MLTDLFHFFVCFFFFFQFQTFYIFLFIVLHCFVKWSCLELTPVQVTNLEILKKGNSVVCIPEPIQFDIERELVRIVIGSCSIYWVILWTRVRRTWIQILPQILTSYVTLGNSLNYSQPQFSDLLNEDNNGFYYIGLKWGSHDIAYIKCMADLKMLYKC